MNAYRFEILGAPVSMNRVWGYRRDRDRPFLTKEAKAFRSRVQKAARKAGFDAPLAGDVSLSIDYFHRCPDRHIDCGNVEKALSDALQGIAYEDDKQVKRLCVERFPDPNRPRLEVTVAPIEPEQTVLWENE